MGGGGGWFWVGGLEQFSVSSRPLGFGFLGLGLRGLVPELDKKHLLKSPFCLTFKVMSSCHNPFVHLSIFILISDYFVQFQACNEHKN